MNYKLNSFNHILCTRKKFSHKANNIPSTTGCKATAFDAF